MTRKTLLEYGRGLFSFLALFLFLLVINGTQLLSLILLPFSRRLFRAYNRFCANTWWSACVLLGQRIHGTRLSVSGDEIPSLENAIVIANHQQSTDIFVIMMFAITKGRLGDLKWLVKDILKYVPGVGWGMLFLDCLFVKRNWDADKNKITSLFYKFKKDQIPLWFISFVEGTRLTPFKLIRCQEYSKEKGLPIFKHVLTPRTKGFVATVQGLSGYVPAVYDITIGYPKGGPSLWQIARGTETQLAIHVKRYELIDLPSPQDTTALSAWLLDRFVEKDRLLEQYYQSQESFQTPAFKQDTGIQEKVFET